MPVGQNRVHIAKGIAVVAAANAIMSINTRAAAAIKGKRKSRNFAGLQRVDKLIDTLRNCPKGCEIIRTEPEVVRRYVER